MNSRCHRKDCIYRGAICQFGFDILVCSTYTNRGEIPDSMRAIYPIDRQKALFTRNEDYQNKPVPGRKRKQVKA